MWKFVTRGIRETLERRANCRTNLYSQTQSEKNAKCEVTNNLTSNHKFLAPSFSAYTKGFCGSTKSDGTKNKDREWKYNAKYSWTEAVGWSSILAVGWVVCQSLCFHKWLFEKDQKNKLRCKLSLSDARISHLVGQVLSIRPNYILPTTNCVGAAINKPSSSSEGIQNTEWRSEKPFGPITVEEALKEATDEFANTHRIVMGEFELHFGIKALEEKRYKDALKHFSTGARLSSPGSMFNLGLCHELGLGTLVDHTKAVKYYSDAAKYNHADAIYNLGVYHAQGRGGLPVDFNTARNYFTKAAQLGQTRAQHALELERSLNTEIDDTEISVSSSTYDSLTNEKCSTNETSINLMNYKNKKHIPVSDVSKTFGYGQDRDMVKTPTEIFLDFLGVNETNPVPVIVGPTDRNITY